MNISEVEYQCMQNELHEMRTLLGKMKFAFRKYRKGDYSAPDTVSSIEWNMIVHEEIYKGQNQKLLKAERNK